jgi:hypothetical protein
MFYGSLLPTLFHDEPLMLINLKKGGNDLMLKPRVIQGSFYDADYICEQLIPKDSFFRKFRELIWPLIKDKDFEPMYCEDNGRPPISPSLLAMATIL